MVLRKTYEEALAEAREKHKKYEAKKNGLN